MLAACAVLSMAIVMPLTACGRHSTGINSTSQTTISPSSNMITRTVNISNFDEIDASRVKVVYTPGRADRRATITAPDNVMQYVEVTCSDGTLDCSIAENVQIQGGGSSCVTIAVTAPGVEEFNACLSAVIEIMGDLNVDEFSAEASTSGSITARAITAREDVELDANTSGNVKVGQISARKLSVDASTSGSVRVSSADVQRLNAEASTSGSLKVEGGSADYVDCEASTSGSVNIAGVRGSRGKLEATTSGSIRANVPGARTETSTGGSIRNN